MVRVYGYTEEFELYSGKFSKSTIFMFSWIELHVVLQNFTPQYSESLGIRTLTSTLLHSHYNLPCYVISTYHGPHRERYTSHGLVLENCVW